jgi:hypothetical protein
LVGCVEGVRLHFAAVGDFAGADDYEAAVAEAVPGAFVSIDVP